MDSVKDAMNLICSECYGASAGAGWWKDFETIPEEYKKFYLTTKLCLIHSEVSEAMEGLRKGLPDDHLPDLPMFDVELADAVIRIADLAGALDINLGEALERKMQYNSERADHKLENRAKEGGKAF